MLLTEFLEYVHNGIINNKKINIEIYKKKLEKQLATILGEKGLYLIFTSYWVIFKRKVLFFEVDFCLLKYFNKEYWIVIKNVE